MPAGSCGTTKAVNASSKAHPAFEGFIPCRDETCSRLGLHEQHDPVIERRGTQTSACPQCKCKDFVILNRKRVECVRCKWRGAPSATRKGFVHA